MYQVLHTISKEFQKFKKKSQVQDIEPPTLNGKFIIDGFNIFISSLYATTYCLKGNNFLTLDFIKENEWIIEEKSPKMIFLDYYFTNTLLFLEEDVKSHISDFEINDENLKKLQSIFEKGEIKSFPIDKKQQIKKDFGKMYEINFGKNILNYKKIEVVPNQYVQNLSVSNLKTLSSKASKIKQSTEEKSNENIDEAMQYFYFSLENFGVANMQSFQKFDLYELNLDTDFIIKTTNNYILSKQIKINKFNQIKLGYKNIIFD